jgi:hypothetical protein
MNADTRDMGIVHSALRRDLRRARIVLTGPTPDDRRRRALGEHLVWMMESLHRHHSGEDEHVWPEIRRRNPAAGPLLDQMDADHQRIAGPMQELEQVATSFGRGGATARDVLAVIDRLEEALLPHLAREEQEMMPVVAQTLTDKEWQELGHHAFIRGKSLPHLALDGHWVIDNATDEDRRQMVTKIPAVPRFILLQGFRRGYARRTRALWAGTDAAGLAPVKAEPITDRGDEQQG